MQCKVFIGTKLSAFKNRGRDAFVLLFVTLLLFLLEVDTFPIHSNVVPKNLSCAWITNKNFCNVNKIWMKKNDVEENKEIASRSKVEIIHEEEFPSLDTILEKARQRNRIPLFFGKIQASLSLDSKLFSFDQAKYNGVLEKRVVLSLSSFTTGDFLICSIASLVLQAYGFSLGYTIGKLTQSSLKQLLTIISVYLDENNGSPDVNNMRLVMNLVQVWPVLLAITLDQSPIF